MIGIRVGRRWEIILRYDLYREVNACAVEILKNQSVCNLITDYFGDDNPWLWNVALNQSIPKQGLSDNQYWHFDYGDSKQLHLMFYVSDVGERAGPFGHAERNF